MNEEPVIDFTIISAEYTDASHIQALVKMKDHENVEFSYFYCPNTDDESPISVYLNNLYKKGELKIKVNKTVENEFLTMDALIKRNTLLNESDHYMMEDYPISKEKKEEMKVYRQALRNIDKQKSFPDNIVWPTKPDVEE